MKEKITDAKKCYFCSKKPVAWTGHYHNHGKSVLIGFCSGHKDREPPEREGCEGCSPAPRKLK